MPILKARAKSDTKIISDALQALTQAQESVNLNTTALMLEWSDKCDDESYPFKGEAYDLNLVKYAFDWLIDHLSEKDYLGAPDDVREMYDMIDFFWRWIERAYFDKGLSVSECLGMLVHSPYAPWNNDREKWDTKHKSYDAEIDKVKGYVLVPVEPTPYMLERVGTINGYDGDDGQADKDHIEWWKAMIDAAKKERSTNE
tara:strand:- start:32721 stop:33320 length:600 start_codon:yes stop_codon:yes gene_type:complete